LGLFRDATRSDPTGHRSAAGFPQQAGRRAQSLPDAAAARRVRWADRRNGRQITENLSSANELARALRLHNIGLSIDDVGEQWPALTEVSDFAFVEIKLDRLFVDGCAHDKLRRLACRQIVEFAQACGARTVAEGVEQRDDYVVLREMGVDQIQGFLMAKPMTAQKLARFRLGTV
jgi:EAL domain-containing protein (putative c-di-GMP-specific phosphodiesterase class I)